MQQPIQIVHSLSGRLRLRVPAVVEDGEFAAGFRQFLLAQPGITGVRINRWAASVVITYDPSVITPPALAGAAERGVSSDALPHGSALSGPAPALTWRSLMRDALRHGMPAWLQLGLGAASFAAGLFGAPPPLTYSLLAGASTAIFGRAIRTVVRERRASVDALDATAGSLMVLRGNLVAAGFMVALIGLGEYIRDRTARVSRAMILDLLSTTGRSAWVVRGGKKVRLPAEQVLIGETVVVYPGDLVPVDGYVISGHAMADQRSLTGEAAPVEKRRGDTVFAATVLVEGKLYLRVEAVGEQTRAGGIVALVQAAPLGETRIQNYAARLADRLVLPIFATAIVTTALTRDVARAISLLIIDFGTGVRIAAPTTILAAMTNAARRGILIKSGASIEKLAAVDAVVFDKTGTLSRGEPEVTEVISLASQVTPVQVLSLAAAAELRLRHPAALAIIRRARREGCVVPDRTESEYLLGLGVRAQVEDRDLLVGNRLLLERWDVDCSPADAIAARISARAESLVYVAQDGLLIGLLAYADPLRPESAAIIADLRRLGVKEILMLTGDNDAVAAAMAAQLDIRSYRAALMPDDKAQIVRELQQRGRTVAVVGDGINDSPALVYADVAISLHHGTDVAREAADVILTDDDLRRVPEAISIARDAMAVVRQSLGIVAVPNGVGLALAAFGRIGPAGATLANNGSTIVAALNSLRPLLAAPSSAPDDAPPFYAGAGAEAPAIDAVTGGADDELELRAVFAAERGR